MAISRAQSSQQISKGPMKKKFLNIKKNDKKISRKKK